MKFRLIVSVTFRLSSPESEEPESLFVSISRIVSAQALPRVEEEVELGIDLLGDCSYVRHVEHRLGKDGIMKTSVWCETPPEHTGALPEHIKTQEEGDRWVETVLKVLVAEYGFEIGDDCGDDN